MIGHQTISPSLTTTYQEAVERIAALQTLDDDSILPESGTHLFAHGEKTERAIILLHGYTSNPRQYRILAEEFFQHGYNVFVPRFPGHGFKDRMTSVLQDQTENSLLAFTNEAMDMAHGLGDQITVLGCSMGGVLALWLAQYRPDISLACALSPALAFHAIPLKLTTAIIKYFLVAPNQFNWWDPQTKDQAIPPLHAYPRYGTRGLAHIANIGLKIRSTSRRSQPKAGSVLLILNPTDESVNNAYAYEIASNWKMLGYPNLRTYEFDAKHNLIHDLIEPDQLKQQIALVYPILLDLIAG